MGGIKPKDWSSVIGQIPLTNIEAGSQLDPHSLLLVRSMNQSDSAILTRMLSAETPDYIKFFSAFTSSKPLDVQFFQSKKDVYFTLESSDNVLGFYCLRGLDDGFDIPSFGVYVSSDFKGRSIARHALNHACYWAKHKLLKTSLCLRSQRIILLLFLHTKKQDLPETLFALLPVIIFCPRSFDMSLYFSSGSFKHRTIDSILSYSRFNDIFAIELSSGLKCNSEELLHLVEAKKMKFKFLVHNYFPAPAKPFVLNIAATDTDSLEPSMKMARRGIDLSYQLGSPFYSVHAGFAAKIPPEYLGNPLKQAEVIAKRT